MVIRKNRKYDATLFDIVALSTALDDINCCAIIKELAKRDLTLSQLKESLKFAGIHIKKLYNASIIVMYKSPDTKEWTYQLSTYGKDKFIEYTKGQKKQ